ncbi:MAG TPA: chorismate mutase [Naasia sp.]
MGTPELGAIRSAIDALDERIVGLLADRQRLVEEAGVLKRAETASAVRAPARVEDVILRVRALAADAGASADVVERTYRAMIAAFIEHELAVHAERR